MTSRRPEQVTCLACREFAGRQSRRFADQIEQVGGLPGWIGPDQAREAARRHRALAREFTPES
jgi:hypothetical protein